MVVFDSLKRNVVLRVFVYYAALIIVLTSVWSWLPHVQSVGRESLEALFGAQRLGVPGAERGVGLDQTALAITVALAMFTAVLLSLPVAWVYILTRAKRGYQQSVVQTLIILPVVVAGVVVMVKYSLALAFSLAGIVAAVRFRNTLDDSKDAVYVFLATGIGLAAAVDVPVAVVVSIGFNATILFLWWTDFGRTPAHFEGRLAERQMRRAAEALSRTGTFVARVDSEIFDKMTDEQLNAVADRAWRRARRNNPEPPDPEGRKDALLRLRTYDIARARELVEPMLDDCLKKWRYGGVVHQADGTHVMEYTVQLKKTKSPEDVLETLRERGSPHVVGVELG